MWRAEFMKSQIIRAFEQTQEKKLAAKALGLLYENAIKRRQKREKQQNSIKYYQKRLLQLSIRKLRSNAEIAKKAHFLQKYRKSRLQQQILKKWHFCKNAEIRKKQAIWAIILKK